MKFITNNSAHSTLHIDNKKYIVHAKYLRLQTDNHINLKNHIEEIIPKLSGACYAVRSMVHINNINNLKSVYYTYFHFIVHME
jgi:hypothetical protein